MGIPNRLNPCKSESSGQWWADGIYAVYEWLNYGATECSCCSWFRGFFEGILFSILIGGIYVFVTQ